MKHEDFRSGLLVSLMQSYVTKLEGLVNSPYGVKVMNFLLALSCRGNSSAFEYVSANRWAVSARHMQRIIAIRRPEPFIHLSRANIMELMEGHIERIRSKSNDDLRRVAFTIGVDATVVVKNVQVAGAHRVVVGLAAPNHFLPIDINMKGEELKKYLKGCAEGKEGELAAEIKVCVMSS